MAIQLIDCLVRVWGAAIEADEQRYLLELEREAQDFSDYYHSAYSNF